MDIETLLRRAVVDEVAGNITREEGLETDETCNSRLSSPTVMRALSR